MSGARRRRPPLLRLTLATQLLTLILLVTLISALAVHTYVREQRLTEAQNFLDSHTKVLADRLSDYETLLLSTYSFLYADQQPGTNISDFITGLHLEQYFPSVHELNILHFDKSGVVNAPTQFGTMQVAPAAREQIRHEIAAATADGSIHITTPFELLPLGRSGAAATESPTSSRSMMIIQPCAPAGSAGVVPTGTVPCVLYMVVNIEQLEQEIDQLTPAVSGDVRIFLDGQPVSLAASAEAGGRVASDPATPLVGLASVGLASGPTVLQASLPRLEHEWTLQTAVPQLSLRDPSTLLAPLVLMMGLLAGLLTYRLVSDQSRMNLRLQQANRDLGASRSFLAQSQADFQAIFEAMDGGAVFTTPDGFIRRTNQRGSELLGLHAEELAGLHMDALREQVVLNEPGNRQSLFSHEAPEEYSSVVRQMVRIDADRQKFWGELSRMRVMGQRQELLGYLHVVRDVSERLETQQKLREQEQRSQAALDGVPHVLWLSDRAGHLTYTNQQFRDLLLGPAVREQLHPADREGYDRLWALAYATGQQQEADMRLALRTPEAVFLHGSQSTSAPPPGWRWVSLKVAPLHDTSGEITHWIAVVTDVHARLMAEQLALGEQEHYRSVLSGMPQLVWTVNTDWKVTYVNGRWYDLQPGLPAPVNLDDLASPIHPDDLAEFHQAVASARRALHPLEVEVQMVGPYGLYRTYVVRAVPIRDACGEVVEWVGTTTDVDDQVRAEFSARMMMQISDALSPRAQGGGGGLLGQRRSYQEAVELLAESLGMDVALWRIDTLQMDTSQAEVGAAERSVSKQVTWLGQSFLGQHVLPPGMAPQIESMVIQAAERRETFVERNSPLLGRLGKSEFLAIPLLGNTGSVRGMLGLAALRPIHSHDYELAGQLAQRFALALDNDVLRERTRQAQEDLEVLNRSLEERVRERTRELDEANRELEAFSYSVSHDLRTPLRHMTGFSELLRKKLASENGDLSKQAERYLSVILDSGQRMGHLIDDLLEFSRTGRAELRQQQIDLTALIGRAWESLHPDREGRRVALQVGPLPTVYGDERLLDQVFTNLLGNALKYSRTKEDVLIQVEASTVGRMAEVRVQDNGAGFDPRYTDKLFGVFQRLHSNDEFEGTGIGLANVRRIILRHGGQVSAHGELGVGATFSVTLPLDPRPEPGVLEAHSDKVARDQSGEQEDDRSDEPTTPQTSEQTTGESQA